MVKNMDSDMEALDPFKGYNEQGLGVWITEIHMKRIWIMKWSSNT